MSRKKPRTCLVIADRQGQLGNRLILFTHYIAVAIEKDLAVFNPYFDEFSAYFDTARLNRYKDLPVSSRFGPSARLNRLFSSFLSKLTGLLFRIAPASPWHRVLRIYHLQDQQWEQSVIYDLEGTEFSQLTDRRFLLMQGWSFRCRNYVYEHREILRELFRPAEPYRSHVEKHIKKCREGAGLLVAVHIRRGDYKNFLSGAYYYDYSDYANQMRQLSSVLFPDKKIRFMICSNEPIPADAFEGLDTVAGPGHFVEDLFAMAACDRIIGPPSTFTRYASFYGNTPIAFIRSKDMKIQESDFFTAEKL